MRQVKQQQRELDIPEAQTRFDFFGPASTLE
jgi:nitric oxide dioxygenase